MDAKFSYRYYNSFEQNGHAQCCTSVEFARWKMRKYQHLVGKC